MNKTRVLLADDHALVRAGISNALQELSGLEIVAQVGDGPALLAALEAEEPELLIVDVRMPEFRPLPTLRQIHGRYPQMRILVISAYDDDVYVQGLLSAGVDGYHLKDQPLSDLKLAVQRVLAGKRWISSPLLDKLVQSTTPTHHDSPLTPRQHDLLRLLQEGLDNQRIAQRLGLSVKTVENHLTGLYRRLEVQSRLEAAKYAREHPEIMGFSGRQPKSRRASRICAVTLASQFTLLLVDDSDFYRSQLRRMVGRASPQAVIYEARNVKEAVRLAGALSPALMLVDVVLGDEDGIRCTRRLKALCPSSRIILISAYPDREFHRLGLEAGAVAFLDKKDLDVAVVRQILEDVQV
ncbi:MAG TPA: response regulator transcription factor [Thermoflexia bacterium]|nr:response regulator transcription factor [Thermoflexia bacterium]